MTTIGNIQHIVAVIRREMNSRISTAGMSVPLASQKVKSNRKRSEERSDRILALIGNRIQAIDPDDQDRGRKAFRIFLESILLKELGESLINDRAFYCMVDDIQRQMEADPQISESIKVAVEHLLLLSD